MKVQRRPSHVGETQVGGKNMKRNFVIFCMGWLAVLALTSQAAAQETKLKWFGHAAFSITTPNGKVLLIDPWLRNPSNPEGKDNNDALAAVSKVDYILLTHGHRDHVGDAMTMSQQDVIDFRNCSERIV